MSQPRIFVAGHRGMVGGAIVRALGRRGYEDVVLRPRQELPLDNAEAVDAFFAEQRPDWVFLAAAKVGGILANDRYSADFIRDNLRIQINVIEAAYRHGARKLLFLGSSCIYPRHAPQPIREDSLLTGALEPTNSAYAVAKIAGKEMCDAYRKQFGFDAFTVMPSNVYGIGDNFDPESSHVAAALMRRIHEAKERDDSEVVIWGTGTPLREFVFSEDIGEACVFLMESYSEGGMINAGSGEEVTIAELARMISSTIGFEGELRFDPSKPDGTPRKIMDNSRLFALGWRPKVQLEGGLRAMYENFLSGESAASSAGTGRSAAEAHTG